MNLISCLKSFVGVVNFHSFSAAASKLHISSSKLSKEIAWLEYRLKTKLFIRSTRSVTLTQYGKLLYPKAIMILQELDQLNRLLEETKEPFEGKIQLFISATPAISYLTTLSLQFLELYKNVFIDILVGAGSFDYSQIENQLILSFEPTMSTRMNTGELFTIERYIYASPDYLSNHPKIKSYKDLTQHNCLINTLYGLQNKWILGDKVVHVSGNLQSNDANVLKQAALENKGLIWVPPFSVKLEEEKGELKKVLPKENSPKIKVYYSYSNYINNIHLVKLLIQFYISQAKCDILQ